MCVCVGAVLACLLAHISDYLSPVSSRGFGLFIGVEIVKDGSAREPDGELAKELIEGSVVAHVQNQQSIDVRVLRESYESWVKELALVAVSTPLS